MPRLQILHHKSYHPYSEKNKQRVREDEEKARLDDAIREQDALDTESRERLNALRRRAGSPDANLSSITGESSLLERRRKDKDRLETKLRKQRDRLDFDWPEKEKARDDKAAARAAAAAAGVSAADDRFVSAGKLEDEFSTGGHVNFWADLESGKAPAQPTMMDAAQRKAAQEADKFTMYLERPDRETKPWYSDRDMRRVEETGDEAERRRARDRRMDAKAKVTQDPLTAIHKQLSLQSSGSRQRPRPQADRTRPQTERERALALLAKRKGTGASASASASSGWETPPSSWAADFERQKDSAGDRFNPDARRRRY